jgi:hypothetical protein
MLARSGRSSGTTRESLVGQSLTLAARRLVEEREGLRRLSAKFKFKLANVSCVMSGSHGPIST